MPKLQELHVFSDVGRRVAELRVERGLTQAKFASKIGITKNHLQQIELGYLNVTVRSLLRLAVHLQVEVADLFTPPTFRVVKRGRPPRKRVPEEDAS